MVYMEIETISNGLMVSNGPYWSYGLLALDYTALIFLLFCFVFSFYRVVNPCYHIACHGGTYSCALRGHV